MMPGLLNRGTVIGLALIGAGVLRERPKVDQLDSSGPAAWLLDGVQQGVCSSSTLSSSSSLPSWQQLLYALNTSATSLSGLAVEVFVTCMLAGLIWTIQLVHYPLFSHVGRDKFPAYEASHTYRITLLVAPLMITEAIFTICACLQPLWTVGYLYLSDHDAYAKAAFIRMLLLVLIWGSTALLQVPCHTILAKGFDPVIHRRLVNTNWIRTICWCACLSSALSTCTIARPTFILACMTVLTIGCTVVRLLRRTVKAAVSIWVLTLRVGSFQQIGVPA